MNDENFDSIKRKKTNKKSVILVVAAVVVSLLFLGIALTVGPKLLKKESAPVVQIIGNLPYEFTEPELNIDPTHEFVFDAKYDPKKVEGYNPRSNFSHAIAVYCDQGMTVEAKDVLINYNSSEHKFHIKPHYSGVSGSSTTLGSAQFSNSGEWGFHDEYFIVQKLDPKTGAKLQKPLVKKFTIQKKLEKPVFSFSVDEHGTGHFSWKPIQNILNYYIVSMEEGSPWLRIIGKTTKTEWTTSEQDKYLQEDLSSGKVYSQNMAFSNYRYSEDDMHSEYYLDEADLQKITKKYFGVIAESIDSMSALSFIDGDEILKVLPNSKARNASKEMKAINHNIKTFDEIPSLFPITMGDGSTALRPVVIDVDNIKIKKQTLYNYDEKTKKYTNKRTFDVCNVPYVIEGTLLNGEYKVEKFDNKTYKKEVQRIVDRIKESQVKTGEDKVAFKYSTEKYDISKLDISKTAPDVPYKISATNTFSEYLAANMIEGNEYIDVSKYMDGSQKGVDLYDAAYESLYQNPYIMGVKDFDYLDRNKILKVKYKISSKEEIKKVQKAVAKEVDSVVGRIIKAGMSDVQKVKAINDYMVKSGKYDYDALNALKAGKQEKFIHAWTPYGILIDKKAVCGGYAKTFKVLADKAGLESVYITGKTNGESHAWNKVKVNGVWKLIDVTWNDSEYEPNGYYLITDKQAEGKRKQTQDKFFVIDVLVNNYITK